MKLKEKLIASKDVLNFDCYTLKRDTVILPTSSKKDRTYIHHPGGVVIIAINSREEILLVNQYRHPIKEITREFPAGKMDKIPNERIEMAAHRELKEETGYISNNLIHIGHTYPSAGILDEKLELFFATDLEKSTTDLDEDEFINIEWISKRKFESLIKDNTISDAKTVAAYFLAKLNNLV